MCLDKSIYTYIDTYKSTYIFSNQLIVIIKNKKINNWNKIKLFYSNLSVR